MRFYVMIVSAFIFIGLSGCEKQQQAEKVTHETVSPLTIKEQPATFNIQHCDSKACPIVAIQTLDTSNHWFNIWLSEQQSKVIQSQIQVSEKSVALLLQPSIDAYVKASNQWQKEFARNLPYQFSLHSHVIEQKKQYVLLMLGIDTQQGMTQVSDRRYFKVVDLNQKMQIHLSDLIQVTEKEYTNALIQNYYQTWLKKQPKLVQVSAPKQLAWQSADWFFDQAGVGLHLRSNEVVAGAEQLDIFLTQEQTKRILKKDVYLTLFL